MRARWRSTAAWGSPSKCAEPDLPPDNLAARSHHYGSVLRLEYPQHLLSLASDLKHLQRGVWMEVGTTQSPHLPGAGSTAER